MDRISDYESDRVSSSLTRGTMNLRREYHKLTIYDLTTGDKVTYCSFNKKEHGIVKLIRYDDISVFVVYHCDNNWDKFYNYTAARTEINDLVLGWR